MYIIFTFFENYYYHHICVSTIIRTEAQARILSGCCDERLGLSNTKFEFLMKGWSKYTGTFTALATPSNGE